MALSFTDKVRLFKLTVTKLSEDKRAKRKALREGAKELQQIVRPYIPELSASTPHRQKGTLKKNLRYRIKIYKNGDGIGLVRIRRAGKKRMQPVGSRLRDRTDPFYWFMVERGTKYMQGRRFLDKGWAAGRQKAIAKARAVYLSELEKIASRRGR